MTVMQIIDLKKKKIHSQVNKRKQSGGLIKVDEIFLNNKTADSDKIYLGNNYKDIQEFTFVDLILDVPKGVKQKIRPEDQEEMKKSMVEVMNQMWGLTKTLDIEQLEAICIKCRQRVGPLSTLRLHHAMIALKSLRDEKEQCACDTKVNSLLDNIDDGVKLNDNNKSNKVPSRDDQVLKVQNVHLEFIKGSKTPNIEYIKDVAQYYLPSHQNNQRRAMYDGIFQRDNHIHHFVEKFKKLYPTEYTNLVPELKTAARWKLLSRNLKEGRRWFACANKEQLYSEEWQPCIEFMKNALLAPTYTIDETRTLRTMANKLKVTTTHLSIAIFGGKSMREPSELQHNNPTPEDEAFLRFATAAQKLANDDDISGSELKKYVPKMECLMQKR
jgi:hypothetical protein